MVRGRGVCRANERKVPGLASQGAGRQRLSPQWPVLEAATFYSHFVQHSESSLGEREGSPLAKTGCCWGVLLETLLGDCGYFFFSFGKKEYPLT